MSRIYLATSWRNEAQPELVEHLRELGHEVYDFRNPDRGPHAGQGGFAWDDIDPDWREWKPADWREALNHKLAAGGFGSDHAGMRWADTCVLLLPSGRSAHIEAGWMKGQGKRVIAYVPEPTEPDLMYSLFDMFVVDLSELETVL